MSVLTGVDAGARVLVTGASSGLGRAITDLFVGSGARVAMLARDGEKLDTVRDELGDRAIPVPVDLKVSADAESAVTGAIEALGGLDIAINAAGVAEITPLDALDIDTWDHIVGTNLTATFVVARSAGLAMHRARSGSIVNVGSDLAFMGMGSFAHYSASKAGVLGLTRSMAAELAPYVRVNAICPGPIDTPMLRAEFASLPDPEAAEREAKAAVPLQRFASPDEIARAVRFLAVDATFATGSALAIDGGTSAT